MSIMFQNMRMMLKKEIMDLEAGIDESAEPLTKPVAETRPKIPVTPIAAEMIAITGTFLENEKESYTTRFTPNQSIMNLVTSLRGNNYPRAYGPTCIRPSGYSSPMTLSPSPSTNVNVLGPTCKWRRSDRRTRRLNTELLESTRIGNFQWAKKCLDNGARSNATCRKDCTTACHVAALMGHEEILLELLHRGANPHKVDAFGRTPLHVAAWAGRVECLAILLDVPEDLFLGSRENCNEENVTENVLDYFKTFEEFEKGVNQNIDERCTMNELKPHVSKDCRDSLEHDCLSLRKLMPFIPVGYTPLHAACSMAQYDCVRALMAAGAKLDSIDVSGRTPLDAVGSDLVDNDNEDNTDKFLSVVKTLLEAGAPFAKMEFKNCQSIEDSTDANTSLHVAVELECLPAICQLLEAGVYPGCFNYTGQTPLHLAIFLKLAEPLKLLSNILTNNKISSIPYVDLKNSDGFTPLHVAVKELWIPGVSILLESGANVSIPSNDGDTALHFASETDELELVDDILSVIKKVEAIDCINNSGETALYKAVICNNLNCVRTLILEGASIHTKLPCNVTMIHKAAELGHTDVLKELLKIDSEANKPMMDDINHLVDYGMNALHLASYNNRVDCVKLLLESGADVRARTLGLPHFQSTALHLAVVKGHAQLTEIILNFDRSTTDEVDLHGWDPLHAACYHGKRECIALLINAGADLASITCDPKHLKKTAMDMLIENVSRPKDFLEEIFDSFIYLKGLSFNDPNCEVKVDYSVLISKKRNNEQMQVIVALLNSGNRFEQKKMLLHPLIESYLYLKWNALSKFFYGMLAFYALFVIALTSLVYSLYYLKDIKSEPPGLVFINFCKYTLFLSIFCISIQESFYMKKNIRKYFSKFETWVKLGSFATSIAFAVIEHHVENEWPRHVTTIAVLLAWTEMMFLLSRFPNWGYYLLMFSKVATNVIKVLGTFMFLLVGFTIAFMLQFHSLPPFDTPWSAMVKTLVMMTSEYDYMSLFDDEHNNTSMVMGRIMFVVFLVLASVVLMNLMVGLAVSDITDLEIQGKMQRLSKQVDFLESLDSFVYNESVMKLLSKRFRNRLIGGRNVDRELIIYPGRPMWSHYKFLPTALKDAIFDKAAQQKIKADEITAQSLLSSQVKNIYEIISQKKHRRRDFGRFASVDEANSRTRKHRHMAPRKDNEDFKDNLNRSFRDSTSPSDIHKKLDSLHKEIDYLRTMLRKVLEKLDNSVNLPSKT